MDLHSSSVDIDMFSGYDNKHSRYMERYTEFLYLKFSGQHKAEGLKLRCEFYSIMSLGVF